MMNENDDILLSQLADGELSSDQANQLLLNVLDDASQRQKLKGLLRLRQMTVGWRTREPQGPVMAGAEPCHSFGRNRAAWRLGGLAVAACVGGLLVLAGVWAAGIVGNSEPSRSPWQVAPGLDAPPALVEVSPEQMQQVAKVFALHESVAGPLAWYADDDQNIRLASAKGAEVSQTPIGVLLKLESATPGAADAAVPRKGVRTLVIVCRNDQPTVIELPAQTPDKSGLRVYLSPRAINDKVEMQYAIAVAGQSQQVPLASLTGQRRLGLAEAPLGQLAMGDQLLSVGAAAWAIQQEHK